MEMKLGVAEIIALIVLIMVLWAFIRDMVKWILGKKKPKVKKEYEVKIFIERGNGVETLIYHRDVVRKVEMWGRRYLEIKMLNGDIIEYEGFKFIVKTYKMPLNEIK